MPWIQLRIEVDEKQADAISELLSEAGAAAVSLEDAADQPLYEPPPGATPLWRATRVVGLFEAGADTEAVLCEARALLGPNAPLRAEAVPLVERDWVRAWMDDFHPMQFGRRLWICPSEFPPPTDPDAVCLLLDPGLAFGTGTHPTTALCLEWLDHHSPSGLDLIDYGCGSGILAIAALRLGARHAACVDNDPQALQATRDNAVRNDVAAALATYLPQSLPPIQTDLLLANILANPLIELAPRFAELVRPGGAVVLSGILAEQADAVAAAYEPAFELGPRATCEGWVRLEGRRKSATVRE